MERPWPLTGRDDQLRRVAAAVRSGGAGVVVAGPPGVGKTRLVREALASRSAGRARVVWAHGSDAARPFPLGAFAGILDVPAGDAVESIGRALDELARQRPFVLAVDDAHQLDKHSAIVLHRVVVRRLAPVLVTLRTGEPAPDIVTSLWKDELLPRIDLGPLSVEETTALISRVLAGPVDSSSARRLWHLTQGSPLFLRHLLNGEVDAGRLRPTAGAWRWTSEPEITPELAVLLAREIGDLPPGVQDVVDVVALAEPVAVVTVSALASANALEHAEDRGLVHTDGRVARLAHPLYGEVRRAAMGALRARRLRGLVARTLDASVDPIPRAVLALDSDLTPDPALFLRAAEAATQMYDLPLAERLARAAASGGDPKARLVHAAALSWLSRGEDSETILSDLAATAMDPAACALAHVHRAGNLVFTLARPVEARHALAEAAATGALPLHVAAMTVALDAATADVESVLSRGPHLLRTELPDDIARILVASGVSAAAAVTGDAALLDEAAAVGGLTAERAPTVVPGFGLADFQVLGHRLRGTSAQAVVLAERMRRASTDLPGPAPLMGLVVAGHAALAAGRVSEALTVLREAWAGLAGSGHEFRFRCRTLLATAHAQAGEALSAGPLLADITADQHPAYRLFVPDDLLARAWGAAAEGSTTEASALAAGAAAHARAAGSPAYEVFAWQVVVQFGDAAAALPRLTALQGFGPRAEVALAHAQALAGEDAAALLAVSDAWMQLGDLVAAGDAAAQAAHIHRRRGREASALNAAAIATRLADQSGAHTPAFANAARPLPLTAREREIVELAARGRTNREIAERFTLSVRTVEGHLYRAGRKLGVSERTDFADVLGIE